MIPGLVNRRVALEIGVAGSPGLRFEGLRIGFRAKHFASGAPSTATVEIYNPALTTISLAQVPLASIRLSAGYEFTAARQIFAGDIVKGGVRVRTQGADRVLELQAADGGAGFERMVTISIVTPTTVEVVLAQLLAQTLWARGLITIPTASLALPQGVTHIGSPRALLDRLCQPIGAVWAIRDGALSIVPKGTPVPEVAPLFSSLSGTLIGSPSPTDTGIEVTGLLDAGMRPGRKFALVSTLYNGLYTAGDVEFEGDSGWDTPFYVRVEGKLA